MVKKREIIFCTLLILITLGLAFSSKIKEIFHKEEKEIRIVDIETDKKECSYVVVTFTGELLIESIQFEIPYGYNFGNILPYLEKYVNEFSVIDYDKKTRFFEDTSIFIETKDNKKDEIKENKGKINIHLASKEQLVSLYGIGEKRADKIIEYRKTGFISGFAELKKIIGVSDEVIQKIQQQAVL